MRGKRLTKLPQYFPDIKGEYKAFEKVEEKL